jgi:hypothetical protein
MSVEEQFMEDFQKALRDLYVKYKDQLEVMQKNARDSLDESLADPAGVMPAHCAGSVGTAGCMGGCLGTFGCFGCYGKKPQPKG